MNPRYHFLLITFFVSICYSGYSQFDGDKIFDESFIHEIRIDVALSPQELSAIHQQYLFEDDPTPYTISTIHIDGMTLDSVGVRAKGGFTAFDPKIPLKIDFNAFITDRRFDGLKKINLHQGGMESSFIREAVAFHVLRKAGVKAARTSFAKVYVNDVYEGIYTLIEQVDNNFIKSKFASNNGTLYKLVQDGLQVKYEEDHSLIWADAKNLITQTPSDELDEELGNYIDVQSFFRFFASQVFLNAKDAPLDIDNNYFLYFEPKSKTYVHIPWDVNLYLFNGPGFDPFPSSLNFLFNKFQSNSILKQEYLNTFCTLLAIAFDPDELESLINSYKNLLQFELPQDPYLSQIGNWEEGMMDVLNVIQARHSNLQINVAAALAQGCQVPQLNVNPTDLVINEILTSNATNYSIPNPPMDTPDWIELFNNKEQDISLEHFYLSNDKDFLKHWRFPNEAIIKAGEYLTIFADKNLDEDGLHCDFKLNKDAGGLYLSFENGIIIDSIEYENQTEDIALARIPNGIGDFNTQEPSFGSNNETTAIIDLDRQIELVVSPIPAHKELYLSWAKSLNEKSMLSVRNMEGLIVIHKKLYPGSQKVELNIDSLNAGIYYVQLTSLSKSSLPIKIVVSR